MPDDGEPVSLLDMTPKEPSALCNSDRSATAGLYEAVGAGETVIFRNARVLTMRDGEVLDHHDVLAGSLTSCRPAARCRKVRILSIAPQRP
jgi:hypothetical protein